jgi:hypothetical protein
MMCTKPSRRQFLRTLTVGALGTIGATACDKNPFSSISCTDTSALTPSELQIRNSLVYVDTSTQPEKACEKCLHFLPAPANANACGACRMVRGPIHPKGTCKSFVGKIVRG